MAKLFHPQWAKNCGQVGGPVYLDWFNELRKYGSKGVLQGIKSVKNGGNSYAPNLNKFVGFCIEQRETGNVSRGDSLSEQMHGGKLKPTPQGVPLCWTQGCYTVDELMESGTQDDADLADRLKRDGLTTWTQGRYSVDELMTQTAGVMDSDAGD